jgi:hypothetical protein
MTSGAHTSNGRFIKVGLGFDGIPIGSRVFFLPPGCSFRLPGVLGVEVDDAWDDFWRGSFTKRLYMKAKTFHMGGRCGHASLPFAPAYGS